VEAIITAAGMTYVEVEFDTGLLNGIDETDELMKVSIDPDVRNERILTISCSVQPDLILAVPSPFSDMLSVMCLL
jgi:hypothetical protein